MRLKKNGEEMSEDQNSGDEQSIPDMEFMDNELDHFDHQENGEVENELSFQASNVSDKEYLDFLNFNTANNQSMEGTQYSPYENESSPPSKAQRPIHSSPPRPSNDVISLKRPGLQSPFEDLLDGALGGSEEGRMHFDDFLNQDEEANAVPSVLKQQSHRSFCNCNKSKCLKMYCSCFRQGLTCGEGCRCLECSNTADEAQKHRKAREEREERKNCRPSIKEVGGYCGCRVGFCQKAYCWCMKNGVECNSRCRCFNCKNKDKGASLMHSCKTPQENLVPPSKMMVKCF